MYPRTRAKGGSNDGSDAGGLAPTSPPLMCDTVAPTAYATADSVHTPSHSAISQHASMSGGGGGRGSSQPSSTHHYAQQQGPPPHMSGGSFFEPGFERPGQSPGPMQQQQQQQPPYYGSNAPGPYNPKHRRTSSAPYDQPLPPPPPLPVAMQGGGYQGDWGMPGGSSGPMMSGLTAPLGSPAGMVSGPGTGPLQPAFAQDNRANSSSSMMTPMMPGGGGVGMMGSGNSEYRPPPMYGDVTGGAMPGLNATAGGNSFANLSHSGPGGGGPNSASMNSSMGPVSSASRRPSHGAPTAVQPPPPPPHLQMAGTVGAPVVQASGGGHTIPGRYYDPAPQIYPIAGPSAPGAAPGVSSLKITVGGSGLKGMPTSAPLSPLINPPPGGAYPQSTQPAPSQQLQQQQQQRSADRGGNSAHTTGVEEGKGTSRAECVSMLPLTGPDTNTEADAVDEEGGGGNHNAGTGVARTTVAQAEARYQYLYEEFRKASRARSKLTEDNERLKREHAVLREELDYYRRKTGSAAEERETILSDYRDDVRQALRVVQALASDVAATASRAGAGCASGKSPSVSPQQVLESVLARLSTASTPAASFSTVHPPQLPPSTTNTAAQSAPPSPSLSAVGSVDGGALPPLADRLGLRCGQWMPHPAGVPPPTPPLDEDNGDRQRAGGLHMQGVLLRDEVRDVHRGTHAAIGAYMTSLDYGFVPVAGQRSLSSSFLQGATQQYQNQQQQHLSTPNLFSSEYRGLHVFVDVPRFHGFTRPVTAELPNFSGAGVGGSDTTGEHSTPDLGVNTQVPPQYNQQQQQQQQPHLSAPYPSSHSRARPAATPI